MPRLVAPAAQRSAEEKARQSPQRAANELFAAVKAVPRASSPCAVEPWVWLTEVPTAEPTVVPLVGTALTHTASCQNENARVSSRVHELTQELKCQAMAVPPCFHEGLLTSSADARPSPGAHELTQELKYQAMAVPPCFHEGLLASSENARASSKVRETTHELRCKATTPGSHEGLLTSSVNARASSGAHELNQELRCKATTPGSHESLQASSENARASSGARELNQELRRKAMTLPPCFQKILALSGIARASGA